MESKVKFADPSAFVKEAVYVEKRYVVQLPNSHTLQDCLRPDYWKPVASRISPLSVVTVLGGADDLDVDLRCVDRGGSFCIMRVIRMMTPPQEAIANLKIGKRCVEYRPGFEWCVIGSDGGILKYNFATQAIAQEHLKGMAESVSENEEEAA